MRFPRNFLPLILSAICLAAASSSSPAASALASDWKPIDPAELALKEPKVERGADAEALFWEVRINDDPGGDLILTHYIRIKVFTERGRESQSKIDIPFGQIYGRNIRIQDIAARTVKPDGSIVELKKADVYERTVIKQSGVKLKVKTFALPGVEQGAIIEYRWREVRAQTNADYVRLHFQREIPVQFVKYYVKPYPYPGVGMGVRTFNGAESKFVKEKDGYYSTTMTNLPAFREEPQMPPEDQVRTWSLLYYTRDDQTPPEKYWRDYGKRVYDILKPVMKANDEVKAVAASAVGDATDPEKKLARLYEFVRTKIKNVSSDDSGVTAEQREKLKENKSPSDTLKRGVGSAADIDMLFAAMATAAGFDARIVLVSPRDDVFFTPEFRDPYFIKPANIAVRVGTEWRFYNPGYSHAPNGMLVWQEEGADALITDPKEPTFVRLPLSGHEKSVERRTATLRLTEDGTLEGDVRIEYTGHLAMQRREEADDESPAEREQSLRDRLKGRMSTAELTDIKIENAAEAGKPLVYSFRVRVPGYAQRTGKRLFLQPAFFQKGSGALFPTSDRKYDVYFHFPWSEQDTVTMELPAGYEFDNPDAPSPLAAGEISRYDVKLQASTDGRKLVYNRTFFFGGKESLLFPVTSYAQLKRMFDSIHERDNHTLALKQSASASK